MESIPSYIPRAMFLGLCCLSFQHLLHPFKLSLFPSAFKPPDQIITAKKKKKRKERERDR